MSDYIKFDDMRAIFCQSNSLTQAWNGFEKLPSIEAVPKDFHDKTYEAMAKRHTEEIQRLMLKRGEWIDTAISIIDDMQREGIIDYEQAWEFRMRARMKGADDEEMDVL